MAILISICLSIFIGIITAEIIAYAPSIARWLIKRAVLKLPEPERDRYLEEWLSHAQELPGNLTKVLHALSCACVGARRIAKLKSGQPSIDERLSQGLTKTLLRAFTWTALCPTTFPALFRFAVTGQTGKFRFLWITQRLLVNTMLHQVVTLKANPVQTQAAVKAQVERVQAILKASQDTGAKKI
jgi:hypothetical protein